MAEITLPDLKPGESGVIRMLKNSHEIRRRLMDLGMTPGALVAMRRESPFGDPLIINVRDCELSLRRSEAALVFVEKVTDA